MTVASQVKQTLASLKSMHASFQTLALTSRDEEAKRTFHEVMLSTEEIIADVKTRIGELEFEEPQYKGF
jgi:signal transduction histidine kinase